MALPREGMTREDVLAALGGMRAHDVDWRSGRVFSYVYSAGEHVESVLHDAASMYLSDNALNPLAFPSVGRMQQDIVDIAAGLAGGGATGEVVGWMTSGGTESILMACKTARDHARATRGLDRGQIVLPTSAHAAFDKAAHYFDMETVRVPVRDDYRADIDATAAAITDRTVLLVGSAPQYPQGVIDAIPELAALARDAGALCHVDACLGGFVLPFLERGGRPVAPWDFRVPGVTSISADVHKYGYASKGASVVLYRGDELRRHQAFVFDDWLGGFYASSGVAGTKPAAPLASAWAVLHYLGEAGYVRLAAEAADATQELATGLRDRPELRVVGDPEVTVCAWGACPGSGVDTFALGDALARRGWYFDRQRPPDSLHATVSAANVPLVAELLADVGACISEVGETQAEDRGTTYASLDSGMEAGG